MMLALNLFRLIITVIAGISGTIMFCSLFIVYIRHWKEIINSGFCEKLQFVLVVTNFLLHVFFIVDEIIDYLGIYPVLGKSIFITICMFQSSLVAFNIWNTTWVSIFYFVRLVNVSHWFFLRVTARFISSAPQLIVGSLLCSTVFNIPMLWTAITDSSRNDTGNAILCGCVMNWNYYYICTALIGIPIFIICLCIGFSIRSILGHVCRMKRGDSHVTSAQLLGHIQAVKAIMFRFILALVFYFIIITRILSPLFNLGNIWIFMFKLIVLLYPIAQTLIIINGSPRLKRRLWDHSANA